MVNGKYPPEILAVKHDLVVHCFALEEFLSDDRRSLEANLKASLVDLVERLHVLFDEALAPGDDYFTRVHQSLLESRTLMSQIVKDNIC